MNTVEEKFRDYYEEWLKQLEKHLQNLVMDRQPNYTLIISSLTSHHKEYYSTKWALAHEDILAFFSSKWLSPLESAFNWVTGWKPTTVFRLVDFLRHTRVPITSLVHLTEDQTQKLVDLKGKIKSEEGKVEREMERQQVALGDRNLAHLARVAGRRGGNEQSRDSKSGPKGVFDGLEKVMKMGDYVRLKTLKGVLDILSPKQGVDFLAVFAMVQLQMRKLGKQRSSINSNNNSSNNSNNN